MSLPYFPMFPTDFEAKTSHLTLAEDGAYNRLLRLTWMTPGCSIPADRTWVYRRMRAHTEADQAVIEAVISEFFDEADGRLSNARLTKEWLGANASHERRKNAGSKGGKAKALKTNETASSNATAMLKQPEPEPEPIERDKSLSKAHAMKTVEAIWSKLPKRKRSLTSKAKLLKPVSQLLKAGHDAERILTAVSRCYSEPRHTEDDGQYAPAVYSWLVDGVWENYAAAEPAAETEDLTPDKWAAVFRLYCETSTWPPHAGPQPGQDGCRAPADLVAKYFDWLESRRLREAAA